MIRRLANGLFAILLCCGLSLNAMAASDMVEVYFLPLQEAADAAKTQLSDSGKVAAIPSRRILILDDDEAHIVKAKALLKRLDHPAGQYMVYLNIEDVRSEYSHSVEARSHITVGRLAGGWIKLETGALQSGNQHRQSFQLRISGNQPGSMETGTLRSFSRATRQWLSGYGVVQINSVEMIPVTSGFHITASPAGSNQVRVRIVPWMQRTVAQVQGQHEILIDLGATNNPATPPSNAANMRLNAQPGLKELPIIELAGAATEVVIPIDQSVTIAAANREARSLGDALLSRFSSVGKRQFIMRLRVSKN